MGFRYAHGKFRLVMNSNRKKCSKMNDNPFLNRLCSIRHDWKYCFGRARSTMFTDGRELFTTLYITNR